MISSDMLFFAVLKKITFLKILEYIHSQSFLKT